jgi:hypothetical protein
VNITLEITPQVQAELARKAAMTGNGVETYAASLLEEALRISPLKQASNLDKEPLLGKRLVDAFAEARDMGLFADGGLDFSRDSSPGRAVDLS